MASLENWLNSLSLLLPRAFLGLSILQLCHLLLQMWRVVTNSRSTEVLTDEDAELALLRPR